MQVVRLIGLMHHDWSKVRESIGIKNRVVVQHDPQWDKPEGRAYKVSYAGQVIGYIPLVPTLRGYYKEAQSDAERERLGEWGRATSKVREWLDSRVKYQFEAEWGVTVHSVLYRRKDGSYTTEECGTPVQISIGFNEVD